MTTLIFSSTKNRLISIFLEMKKLISLSLFYIFIETLEIGVTAFDTLMLARYSTNSLAGASLVSSVILPLIIFVIGFLSAEIVNMGQAIGTKDAKTFSVSFLRAFITATLLGIIMSIIYFSLHYLLKAFTNQNQNVILETKYYSLALIPGIFPSLWYFLFKSYYSLSEQIKRVAFISFIMIGLNILFNYMFIFGKFGFSEMGIIGAGLGTSLSLWIGFLLMVFFLYKDKKLHNSLKDKQNSSFILQPVSLSLLKIKDFYYSAKVGISSGLNGLLRTSIWAIGSLLIANVSLIALASYAISGQIANISFIIPVAIAQVATLRSSIAVGQKNQEKFQNIGFASLIFTLVFSTTLLILFLFFPKLIVNIFITANSETNLIISNELLKMMKWIGLFQFCNTFLFISIATLLGAKDTKVAFWTVLVCFWFIAIPLAYYLTFYTPLKVEGFWIAVFISYFLAATILFIRFIFFKINSNIKLIPQKV